MTDRTPNQALTRALRDRAGAAFVRSPTAQAPIAFRSSLTEVPSASLHYRAPLIGASVDPTHQPAYPKP